MAECSICIVPNYEVALDDGVWIEDGSTIKGDSVYLAATSSVWDVLCNELSGSGRVRGAVTMPLDIPVWETLIEVFPSEFNPAKNKRSNVNVGSHQTETLFPGEKRYYDVTVGSHAKLFLDPGDDVPGIFHFNKLILGSHASLICLGPSEIRIKEQLVSVGAKSSYLGPAEGADLNSTDVVIYVAGSSPAVMLGQGNRIRANLFAKNGSFVSGEGGILTGSFIARDITIGQKSIVNYNGVLPEP